MKVDVTIIPTFLQNDVLAFWSRPAVDLLARFVHALPSALLLGLPCLVTFRSRECLFCTNGLAQRRHGFTQRLVSSTDIRTTLLL